ncbi:Mitochondrial import inner membrane translocase subunit Tim9 [Bagarius yarrelli]|uniref:Mitochondrial import inner membrane translocase subunit n=1 Tax=Bagarius yarrelli TaxID=175774 RepID=A0A556U955_BAGYA|nr:Mitochondrial import inner membrane translocase subunit Tim9 [Bagarius yarrelli]
MAAQVTESDQIKQVRSFRHELLNIGLQTSCSESCLQKYLKMTQRISMRFQEYHIQQNEALAAKAGLLGQPR